MTQLKKNGGRGVSQGSVDIGTVQICQSIYNYTVPPQKTRAQNVNYGGPSIYLLDEPEEDQIEKD